MVKHNQHEVGTAADVRYDRVLELEVSTRAFRSFTVPGEGPYVQRWLGESKRNPEKAPKRSKKVPEGPRIPEKAPRRPEKAPPEGLLPFSGHCEIREGSLTALLCADSFVHCNEPG